MGLPAWLYMSIKILNMKNNVIEKDLKIRKGKPSDHAKINSVMQQWWDGRDLTAMLPKLFFIHFRDTVLILEQGADLIGFLVGFLSQSHQNEAHIHFVGVHPDFRKKGLGSALYNHFFDICQKHKRTIIRACTSPVNKGSIEFHKKMGFQIEPGNGKIEGVPVTLDYNRPGDHKISFAKSL
jgi:hypothetical protein